MASPDYSGTENISHSDSQVANVIWVLSDSIALGENVPCNLAISETLHLFDIENAVGYGALKTLFISDERYFRAQQMQRIRQYSQGTQSNQ